MKKNELVLLKLLAAILLVIFGVTAHSQQSTEEAATSQKDPAQKVSKPPIVSGPPTTVTAPTTITPAYLPLTGGTMLGPLQLAADPTASTQAATKNYIDQQLTTVLPLAGGTIAGSLATQNAVSKMPRVDVRHADFAGGADPTGTRDSLPAIQAAIAFAVAQAPAGSSAYPTVYIPDGLYKVNGTINLPMGMHLIGDSKGSTVLQETNATANLITAKRTASPCFTGDCYGSIEKMVLRGSGRATTGSLLEIQGDSFTLREIHFYNTGGRGLQMNNSAERIGAYDLSFYYVRWPIVMAGDTNENYFYNTHIWGAGSTDESASGAPYIGKYCYSVNCTAGYFNAAGTVANPTVLYPDPHAAIYIDKAVNVGFFGGTLKAGTMLSAIRVWNGALVKFQNLYHEDEYSGSAPSMNRAYILGGKAEQTYLTATLGSQANSVAVHDVSWMPQYYGSPTDATAPGLNTYGYVILPQDYNRASSAPSAYVAGVQQNQFEIIWVTGFASDGNMYVAARNAGGSSAPAGTQWPAGSVVEQFTGGFEGAVELDNVHINQVQGAFTANGYTVHCDQASAYTCGEIVAGYSPDIQSPTADPATNQVGFYAPLGDPNDPVPYAEVTLHMRNVEMFNSPANPYMGQIATHHFALIQMTGSTQAGQVEGASATETSAAGVQLGISSVAGGSFITAPLYSTGRIAETTVSLPDSGEYWEAAEHYFVKKASVFGPYQQFGLFMNGEQFQNSYCLFDTAGPSTNNHVGNRFCVNGGPDNGGAGSYFPATGGGIEYNSWNGNNWSRVFYVNGVNGVGSMTVGGNASVSGSLTSGTLAAGSVQSSGSISAASVSATGTVSAANLAATANVTANSVTASGNVAANSMSTTSLSASGNVMAGSVSATSVTASNTVAANSVSTTTMTAAGNVTARSVSTGNITATGSLTAASVSAGNVTSTGTVAGTSVTATTMTATGAISSGSLSTASIAASGAVNANSVTASGSVAASSVSATTVSASGSVSGASVSASGTVSATNVNTTNLTATGTLSAGTFSAGTVSTSGNLSAGSVTATNITAAGTVSAADVTATGSLTAGAITGSSVTTPGAVSAGSLSTNGTLAVGQNTVRSTASAAVANSLPKVGGTLAVNSSLPLVWSSYGPCFLGYANCVETGVPITFPVNIVIQGWGAYLLTPGVGCTTVPTLSLKSGSTTIATVSFANGVSGVTATGLPVTVAAGTGLQVVISTPAAGCTTFPATVEQSITYAAAD